jgi:hypothetical protein
MRALQKNFPIFEPNFVNSHLCGTKRTILLTLVMAWPFKDSTLKLLVLVGKIRKATTVTSDPCNHRGR